MSRATKRKHVQLEVIQDDFSHPKENQQIVKVLACKGNHLFEVETTDDSTFLVSMPVKFRGNVWVRRGSFLIVEPIEEGGKVKAEIARIVTPTHIKYFKRDKVWPKKFDNSREDDSSSENSDDDDIFVNTNRSQISDSESSGDSESGSEESDVESSDDKEDEICDNTSKIKINNNEGSDLQK